MSMLKNLTLIVICILLAAAPVLAQVAGGSITGVIQDPQGAVIPNAKVTLTNNAQGQGSAREVSTSGDGTYLFTPVLPGTYTLTVETMGFKKYTQANLTVNVNDRLGLAPIALEVGSTNESVTVEASAVQLETITAERSGVVTGRQMVDIALNGRNFTGLLRTVPGATADASGTTADINGQRNIQNNYTVDGQTITDIGTNAQNAYRVNVDAIAEFKVSTNGQSAEFGRNSGAQIQLVTKAGSKDFHGDGYYFKRGEWMNANTFTNNYQNIQIPLYRFMTAGYTVGGPIYIPGHFNKDREKLFGFLSHEWNRANTPNALRQITVPTEAERRGDFSNTRDAAGVLQTIYDPLTPRTTAQPLGTPFPNNQLPATRFNEYGPSVLNWLPKPNVFGQPNYNYQSQALTLNPSYDQVYRVDYNLTDKWRIFVRHLNAKNTSTVPYGRLDTANNLGITNFTAPTYSWSLAGNVTTIINPTLTNEAQFGYTVNGIPGNPPPADSPFLRAVSNVRVPVLYSNVEPTIIPNFDFAGTPTVSGTAMTTFAGLPYDNRNPIWNFADNITKSAGNHTYKFGLFYEYALKSETSLGRPYNGTFNFGRDNNNPNETNWPFSNALIGTFNNFTQASAKPLPHFPYNNFEFYGQDTWKITKKLTLNYGLRVVFPFPFYEQDGLASTLRPELYDPKKAVTFFQPIGTGANRRAQNPITGELLPAVYIGAIVPGVGDFNNGLVVANPKGDPKGLLQSRGAHWGPRIGLAYQINNKTVFRLGGGVFYERVATGASSTAASNLNPPLVRIGQVYYGNLSTMQAGAFFPTVVTVVDQVAKVPTVYNYNAGIQRELPFNVIADISYVGSQSRHLSLATPFNNAPFGSAWLPSTQDPTGSRPLDGSSNLLVNMYRPYPGYVNGNLNGFGASSNYNALQIAINRRRGPLQFGISYSWSKALGVIQGHITDMRAANYGPLALDRTQGLVINYIYDIPRLSRPGFLDNAPTRLIFNNWQFSGLSSFSGGAPVNVTYSITGVGATLLNRQITGSEDNAPRPVFTCNPLLSRDQRTIDAFINTSCFAPAKKGSVQMDSGLDRLRGPGIHNWDMSLFKNIQFGSDFSRRLQLRLEAYNVFNHTQWGTMNTTVQFNSAGVVQNLPIQVVGDPRQPNGGRLGFGALNSIRANSQRILQIAVKLYF
jgi:hypothetical protein